MPNASGAQISPVERALYYAARLLARMDEYAGHGNAFLAPEVVVWVLEQLKPTLVKPLHEIGRVDELVQLLRYYNSLRETAEEMRRSDFHDACSEAGIQDI